MKYKVVVSGYKPYNLVEEGLGYVIDGNEKTEIYIIDAYSEEEAIEKAIEKFEEEGGYFDEIVSIFLV